MLSRIKNRQITAQEVDITQNALRTPGTEPKSKKIARTIHITARAKS